MKTLAIAAVPFVVAGWILLVVAKKKPAIGRGWALLCFSCACGLLAIRSGRKTQGLLAFDQYWWEAFGYTLLTIVGLLVGVFLVVQAMKRRHIARQQS